MGFVLKVAHDYFFLCHRCNGVSEPDDYVIDLAMRMRTAIFEMTGHYPHVVLNLLHRTKLDANRRKDEATFGVPTAEMAYDEYYKCIHMGKSTFTGPGLLIDVHGHSHPIVRTELGYLLSAKDLDTGKLNPGKCSIRALASRVHMPFADLLRGQDSLGGLLQSQGYMAVPSPANPGPGKGNSYFTGQFTVESEGSRDHGNVDAIMAESPHRFREDNERPKYAKAFARALVTYVNKYYSVGDITSNQNDKVVSEASHYNTGMIVFGGLAVMTLVIMVVIVISKTRKRSTYQSIVYSPSV